MSKICPNCKVEFESGKFCPECGSPLEELPMEFFCPECGKVYENGKYCPDCGARLQERKSCGPSLPPPSIVSDNLRSIYSQYCKKDGSLKDLLMVNEADRLLPILEKASADGDEEASLLLADMKSRVSQNGEAIRIVTPLEQSSDKDIAIKALLSHMSFTESNELRRHLYDTITQLTTNPTQLEYARLYLALSVMDDGLSDQDAEHYRGIVEELTGSENKEISQVALLMSCVLLIMHGDYKKASVYASRLTSEYKLFSDSIMGYSTYNLTESENEKKIAGHTVLSTAKSMESVYGNDFGYVFGWAGEIADDQDDDEEAFRYYTLGAEREDSASMAHLGVKYLEREGDSRDVDKALFWLKKAKDLGEDVDSELELAKSIKNKELYLGFAGHQLEGENSNIVLTSVIVISDRTLVADDDMVYLAIFNTRELNLVKTDDDTNLMIYGWRLNPLDELNGIYLPLHCVLDLNETELKDYSDGRIDLELRLFSGKRNGIKFNLLGYKRIPPEWDLLATIPFSVNHIHHFLKKDEWYIIDE